MKHTAPKLKQLHQFMEQYNFATLISQSSQGIQASPIPVLLKPQQGDQGTLAFHLAKSNPQAQELAGNKSTLFIFHGPHAYISPAWYKNSPSVPTWNYAMLRAFGEPRLISRERLSVDVDLLARQHEKNPAYATPQAYKARLLDYVIGFEMEITRLEPTFKLGLNRSQEDQAGMLEGLEKQKKSEGLALADFIKAFQGE